MPKNFKNKIPEIADLLRYLPMLDFLWGKHCSKTTLKLTVESESSSNLEFFYPASFHKAGSQI
jgi:hypothetical protein